MLELDETELDDELALEDDTELELDDSELELDDWLEDETELELDDSELDDELSLDDETELDEDDSDEDEELWLDDDTELELTAYEYKVIEYLVMNSDKVISKTELTEHIYEQDFDRDSNVIEVFVGRLRKKLDPKGNLKPIETLRGRGYRWNLTAINNETTAEWIFLFIHVFYILLLLFWLYLWA